jgi:selenocysteine-specific elongation factor
MRILGTERLEPGAEGSVRIHLPVPLALVPGDRYVLREAGRVETVGGGEVLDVAPVLPASKARPSRSVERIVAERRWIDVDQLERLTGERHPPTLGRWVVAPDALAASRERLQQAIVDAGPLGLDVAALDDLDRAVLSTVPEVEVEAGRARAATAPDPLADHPYVSALEAAPFAPPSPEDAGAARGEVRELVRRGVIVERDGVFFAASAMDAATRRVAELLAAAPDGVTVAQVRDALSTTRKYLLPLLGELDARGVTRRRGDVRIAGPRLPTT